MPYTLERCVMEGEAHESIACIPPQARSANMVGHLLLRRLLGQPDSHGIGNLAQQIGAIGLNPCHPHF